MGLMVAALMIALTASAQFFPLPASTPNTPVSCPICVLYPELMGNRTVGYPSPFSKFVGRYVDSSTTLDWQSPFRTTRAGFLRFAPERNRLYMRSGQALAAYNLDTFFTTKLASGMVPISQNFALVRGLEAAELFLPYSRYLYPEFYNSGWTTNYNPDGQDRLFDMDWDDRGLIYTAYGPFNWGISRDDSKDGAQFEFVYQGGTGSSINRKIISLKIGTRYYVLVGDETVGHTDVFDVTDPSAVTTVARGLPVALGSGLDWQISARSADRDQVAVISSNVLKIYPASWFVSSSGNPRTFDGRFTSIDSDGSDFWVSEDVNGVMTLDLFAAQGNTFRQTSFPTGQTFFGNNLHFDSGFVVVTTQRGQYDVRVFRINDQREPELVPLGNYITKYYSTPAAGYARATHLTLYDAAIHVQNGKAYLLLAFSSLGDVYEMISGFIRPLATALEVVTQNPMVVAGQQVSLSSIISPADATGTVVFKDGSTTLGVGDLAGGAALFETSLTAGSHDITATYAGDVGHFGSSSNVLPLSVSTLQPPDTINATAIGSSSVNISWSASAGAGGYQVYRSSGGALAPLLATSGTLLVDTGLAANTTYVYEVRAVAGSVVSALSAPDAATTIVFTDPILAGATIKAVHVTELRTAINAMLVAALRPPMVFTDSSLNGLSFTALHLAELRSALADARAGMGLPPMSFTDPVLTAGSTVIKAVHLQELRAGVQ